MKFTLTFSVFLVIVICNFCNSAPAPAVDHPQSIDEPFLNVEYERYLREVTSVLEKDKIFMAAIANAHPSNVSSVSEQLQYASHHVRTKLDEIKREEVKRLRKLMIEQNGYVDHGHLDNNNWETFENKDLHNLLTKVNQHMSDIDRTRREEFKQYEMQKEYEKQRKLNDTADVEEREKLKKEFEALEQKHKDHEPLHEPGHKAQLEEVWQEQDQMIDEFNPRVFFVMHDLDSNGYWDEYEVKALMRKELDKMYDKDIPEDDMLERIEEMERMREKVVAEVDKNADGLISYPEFLAHTNGEQYKEDHGWKGVDEQKMYTDEEINKFYMAHETIELQPEGVMQNNDINNTINT